MSAVWFCCRRPNFVTPFAPQELPCFNATTRSSDFQKKNASDLVVKLDFDLNIHLTFPGSPKFPTQPIGCMPRSRTPVDRFGLFLPPACCLRTSNKVSASTLCSIHDGAQSLHFRCGLQPLCLRFATVVTSHPARLDTTLVLNYVGGFPLAEPSFAWRTFKNSKV
jgi:hypothetical protein